MNCFMGIDIGSYETKGVIINDKGELLVSHAVKHEIERPAPDQYEHDAEKVWWHDFSVVAKALLEKAGIPNKDIRCVGFSTLGADVLPVDEHCKPLRKAILYGIDCRALKEIAYLNEHMDRVYLDRLDSDVFCTGDIPPKILWIKNNEPEVYSKTYKFLTGSSYIGAKLTGNYTVDRYLAMAPYAPFYFKDGTVDPKACESICRPDQLPEVYPSTGIIGRVTEQAAAETGLMAGTPVIAGTDDAMAEAISTGVLGAGSVMIMLGSTLFLTALTDGLVKDSRIWGTEFVIPDTFAVNCGTNAAGALTRWARDALYFDALAKQNTEGGPDAYSEMVESIRDIPAGSNGLIVLPYFAGERTPLDDPFAKGMFFGMTLNHTREHMFKAILEAIGYTISQLLDILQENGVGVRELFAVGGGTKNPIWLQIIADITGHTVITNEVTIGASYADALMAGIGHGTFRDFEALKPIMKKTASYEPNPENRALYQSYKEIYLALYERTKDLMHALP